MMATVAHIQPRDPLPLPANIEAEQALIGAVLMNNRVYDSVSGIVGAYIFHDEFLRGLWAAMAGEIEAGRTADPITLKASVPNFEGNHDYVARLAAAAMSALPENTIHYAKAIRQAWAARQMIGAATEAADRLHAVHDADALDAIAADLQDTLDRTREGVTERRPVLPISDAVSEALAQSAAIQRAREAGDTVPIVSTGLHALDRLVGGFFPGEMIVAAGATGMGKSALAQAVAEDAAGAGDVVFFSLEMSKAQLGERILAARTGVPAWAIRRGVLKLDQWDRVREAEASVAATHLLIDDNGGTTLSDIRRAAKDIRRRGTLRLIVVDYLQLMGSENRFDNRVAELSAITRGLKRLARELDVPILALSQLNRTVDTRDDKRPQLSDLRESGSIEQDADVVLFCYRPGYYVERKKPQRASYQSKAAYDDAVTAWEADVRVLDNEAEIIVAKQRQGPANQSAKVRFERNAVRFVDLPEDADQFQQGMEF